MENINSAISINLRDGNVTISGSEAFIEKNIQIAFDFVERNLHLLSATSSEAKAVFRPDETHLNSSSIVAETTDSNSPYDVENEKYISAGVYHIDKEDGTISILKKIPGSSKSEKTKNIALIVLYIRKGKVPGKELIPICEKHACYDSTNFSSIFKNEKTNIIRKGTGQNWTIELTQPGRTAAIALLEEMANDTK